MDKILLSSKIYIPTAHYNGNIYMSIENDEYLYKYIPPHINLGFFRTTMKAYSSHAQFLRPINLIELEWYNIAEVPLKMIRNN